MLQGQLLSQGITFITSRTSLPWCLIYSTKRSESHGDKQTACAQLLVGFGVFFNLRKHVQVSFLNYSHIKQRTHVKVMC